MAVPLFTRRALHLLACGLCALFAPSAASSEFIEGAVAGEVVEKFTGGHTRVVWVVDSKNEDTFANGPELQLMGYDSRDGLGQRIIVPGPLSITSPLLTPDGRQVVYSDQWNNKILVVDFDGGNLRELGAGMVTDLWKDPQSGEVWVYAQQDARERSSPIVRFPISAPENREVVWNSTDVQVVPVGGFQVSQDGTRASGLFPWPNAGAADLPDVAWRKQRDGCWPSMAPDNSHMMWIFDGSHKRIIFSRPGEEEEWKIDISEAPGINRHKVYHPRWSNDVRYFAMTGPYAKEGGELSGGGPQVELYLGKFSEDFKTVEGWLQLTSSDRAAFFPDAWIEKGAEVRSAFHRDDHGKSGKKWTDIFSFLRPKTKFSDQWPVTDRGLVFLWENNQSSNDFKNVFGQKRSARLAASGGSRWGANGEMHIINGGFVPEDKFAGEIREACMQTNLLSLEAIIIPSRTPQYGPARIVSLSGGTSHRNFTLGQEGDDLVIRLQTSDSNRNGIDFNLAPLKTDVPNHVVVTYEPGHLVCYINGVVAVESRIEKGNFEDWRDYDLFFGKEKGSQRFWEGFLENVAIYNRILDPEEVLLKFQSLSERLGQRPPSSKVSVTAEMLTREEPPTVEEIAPYRRALAVNRYRVIESDAPAPLGEVVQVAEWTMLDGVVPAAYRDATQGTLRHLELEQFSDHPQLESERLLGDGGSLDEELYYDVSSGR